MRILLDTHTFIWWDSNPGQLSPQAMSLCQDSENTLLLSVASVWEMQIKTQLGKMKLGLPLRDIIESQQQTNDIVILPVQLEHTLALDKLPPVHKDPFDRLLIAQAMVENALLISADPIFSKYAARVVW